jgi:hypothetical protein
MNAACAMRTNGAIERQWLDAISSVIQRGLEPSERRRIIVTALETSLGLQKKL